jgi:peptidyl-dipeptidase A
MRTSLDSKPMPHPARIVADLEARLRPLETAMSEAWWEASTRSSPEADRRRADVDLALREALADGGAFAEIDEALTDHATDPLVRRQLELLHDAFVPHQVPAELRLRLVELETSVDSAFSSFRGEIAGRPIDDNEIAEILRTCDDAVEREAAWKASKQVGAAVADRVRELARVRNDAARSLGYRDHFALALATSELDEDRLFTTLDEVERATRGPFTEWKTGLDAALARRFGCTAAELRPWHYDDPFFQEPAARGSVDLDPLFSAADLNALTVRTYAGLGLDVQAVMGRSDLLPRDGKSQHAFCIDVDRAGDVRVLANVVPNERWMSTMLHEFGHAVYDCELDATLPWLLRRAAHPLTTEGIAMLFGRLPRDPEWLGTVAGRTGSEVARLRPRLLEAKRVALLVFARWVLVMTHFERGLYAAPGADHDTRWWELVERFQLLTRPDGRHGPDWAAKIHLASAPVYYQNYLYGELFASQLDATLTARAGGLVDRQEAGRLLVDEVFRPGSSLRWDRLVEKATGEPLSASHLARQFST